MTRLVHPLRLLAHDADDLQVLSAALQDAIAKVGDIRFDPADRTLTLALNRFRRPIPHVAFLALGVYWLGQLGIAIAASSF
jgi:hypothetical protein